MNITQRVSNPAKCRVHLHIHLEGSMRTSTLWDLRRQKNLQLPGNGALWDLEETLKIRSPGSLAYCLERFQWILPALEGDLAAIERVAFEFVEDEARNAVLYTEPRFSPHLLVGPRGQVTARQVTEAVLRGLGRAERQFGVTARLLLCCIRGMAEHYMDTLDICTEYRDRGVVGMDIAGDEALAVEEGGDVASCVRNSEPERKVFQEAARRGIHRTVHAGEAGPAYMVQVALDELHAERIGHGYSVLEDEALYRRCIREGVHFECCPSSSYLAGLVSLTQTKHPIQRFCEDGANFSANLDDTAIFQHTFEDEHTLLRRMGFTEANFTAMNFNAAKACFLPEAEKKQLLKKLVKAYAIPDIQ